MAQAIVAAANMVDVQEIHFSYPHRPPLLDAFSWAVRRGDSWAVIGPSGCGKTTLLYLLAGLRLPRSGYLRVAGEQVARPRNATGLILQDFGLLPWASARSNIELGLRLRAIPQQDRHDIGELWLDRLGLKAVAEQYPGQLSGGQRQRVAIARTLALDPDLLLMDEPFSSLDALTREALQNLVLELGIEDRLTTILVSHNIEEAVLLGRRLLVLRHPPHSIPCIIENPLGGRVGYRYDPAFQEKCAELRRLIEDSQFGK